MQRPKSTQTAHLLCVCGRRPDGVDARTKEPSCRFCATREPPAIADGGRDLTDGQDTHVGIRHDLDQLPEDITELSDDTQRAIVGGFSRSDLIDLIRDHIGSETTTKTDRLAKGELVTILIQLHIGDRQ